MSLGSSGGNLLSPVFHLVGPTTPPKMRRLLRPTEEDLFLRRPGIKLEQTKLRPSKEKRRDAEERTPTEITADENGVVQLQKISQLLAKFAEHFKAPYCFKPVPSVNIVKRKGLCLTLNVICENCAFQSSPVKMYEEIKLKISSFLWKLC